MKRFYLSVIQIIIIAGLIITTSCDKPTKEKQSRRAELTSESIAVGIFKGNGAAQTCVTEAMEALKMDKGIVCVTLTAAEIVRTELETVDVLLFPGGSGSKSMNNLGDEAAKVVEKFVKKKGKGIVGICAGAYLLSNTPNYPSLGLLNAKVIDRDHYNRGNGLVEFKLTPEGENIFPELIGVDKLFVEYYEGPILEVADKTDGFTNLATFVSDVHQKGDSEAGITPGKPYFINLKAGKGKIFAAVGHPESTPGMRWMVPRMVRWVANKELISYEGNVVRPELFTEEILHTSETDENISNLFDQLFADNPGEVIAAIDELENLRAWEGKKWIPGLLRSENSTIKLRAAKYIADIEYTASIPDLEVAVSKEKNDNIKAELEKHLMVLQSMVKR